MAIVGESRFKFKPLEQLAMLEDLSKINSDQILSLANCVFYFMPADYKYSAKEANDIAMRLYKNGPEAFGVSSEKQWEVKTLMDSFSKYHVERGYRLVREGKVKMIADCLHKRN